MRSPTPRTPRQPASERAATEDQLSDEMAAVVTAARRRAQRDGDRQVDTAHLLHSLIEADPDVRTAFDGRTQLARVLGYLVQRSIGYGLRWQGSVEDSGAVPVLGGAPGAPRTGGSRAGGREGESAGWSPAAAAAMDAALLRAGERGDGRATGLDLLAELAGDRESRAVQVLEHAGVDPGAIGVRADELSQQV
ncbi:Clp protease N-terminal domain-containing protein [Streptomyces sp. NPDC001941]|uniref:Clp protease N-terminal domain-containing protein n=1 Tax=Streptomyces sp. NPDC001941 TaxID=3154659 RepID=UPI00332636D4